MENNNEKKGGWEILKDVLVDIGKNNKNNTTTTIKCPSFLTLLAILFIGLKLAGKIAWSWWWVLSPIWIPTSIALFLVLVFIIIAVVIILNDK